jgi:hypothetical protein
MIGLREDILAACVRDDQHPFARTQSLVCELEGIHRFARARTASE